MLTGTGLVVAVIVVLVVTYAYRGFDVTDEGFYLNLIARPAAYGSNATAGLFPYVWHPIYVVVGGDIGAMRLINIGLNLALTFALAWTVSGPAVAALVTREDAPGTPPLSRAMRIVTSASAAVTSLAVFERWLVTPNYNSLAYQATVLTIWCCLLVMSGSGRRRTLPLVGIAAGGWLCLLAKPTSAVSLGIVVALLLLAPSRRSWRTFGLLAVSVLSVAGLSLLLMRMSVRSFVGFYQESFELTQAMGGHSLHDMFARDPLLIAGHFDKLALFGAASAIVLGALCISQLGAGPARAVAGLSALVGAAVSVVLLLGLGEFAVLHRDLFGINHMLALPAALLILFVFAFPSLRQALSSDGYVLFGLFLILPAIATFGTNNNMWLAWSRVAAFWVVAGIVVAAAGGARLRRALMPFFAAAQALTVLTLVLSVTNPYRQATLDTADVVTPIGHHHGSLAVASSTAGTIGELKAILEHSAASPRPGVVDLTGQSPGLIYAAGARALGQAWILGGYPGSADIARIALKQTSCADLKHAVIFTWPENRRAIDPHVLSAVGLELGRDFVEVGRVPMQPGELVVSVPRPTIRAAIQCRP